MIRLILVLILLTLAVVPVWAAAPSNPAAPLPQPIGASRFYTQFELRAMQHYRSTSIDARESPGNGGGSSGGDAGAGAAASSGDSK